VEFHTPHFREVSNLRLDSSGRILRFTLTPLAPLSHKRARGIWSAEAKLPLDAEANASKRGLVQLPPDAEADASALQRG
jgi:hypothetical protein